MSIYKCKMCGGELEISESQKIITCPYCGSSQSVPNFNSEKKAAYYSKANSLRFSKDFSKASCFYELITSEFPEDAEAYWCLVLCKFGIEYVDGGIGKKIPTCHNMIYKSIFEDEDYRKAIRYSDVVTRELYENEAKEIDKLQNEILELSDENEFDIFICYKETDIKGERTEDSVLAQRIYKLLNGEGYKVFFSRITLEGKIGEEYEPIIYSALNSARVLIHVTTSIEYTNSIWVKNEWERFINRINKKRTIIPCYKNIKPLDLPRELRFYQGLDFNKIGAEQDLIDGISKYFIKAGEAKEKNKEKKEREDYLLPVYQDKVRDLFEIDQFCSYSRDIYPLIKFFEENIEYLDSKKYLIEAKYQYARHVDSYNDCIRAEEYINEIKPYKDSEDLLIYLKDKKTNFRHKELVNEGYIIGIPKNCSIQGVCEITRSLLDSIKRINNANSLTDEDIANINVNHLSVVDFLSKNLPSIIKESSDIDDLEKLKWSIEKMEKNNIDISSIIFCKNEIDAQIHKINLQISLKKRKQRNKKIRIISIISTIILTVIGTITGLIVGDKVNHSASRISFKVTNKTQEYNPDVSPYINGCYFIYFNYKISSSSTVGVDYMKFVTYIKKDGESIGSMTTSLENMNLASKSTKSYTIYLQDNQPETNGNEFFITLYNAAFASLSLTFEVLSISFSDGRYYLG